MIYFLLPAFNEEQNIGVLLKDISKEFKNNPESYKIILIDDGSSDSTKKSAESLSASLGIPIIVISHEKNKGLGMALKTGIDYLNNFLKANDFVIIMDSDNTHPPELSKSMVNILSKGEYSLIIASRYCQGGEEVGLKLYRKILSKTANLLLKIAFPYPGVSDYTTGYRAYKGELLLNFKDKYEEKAITEKGFAATVEILIKLLLLSPKIKEVPLILQYQLKKGKSKIKILPTIIAYFRLILKY